MSSLYQRRIVLITLGEITIFTSLGPLVYYFTKSEWVMMFWLSFNAALNIVGYEYAVRAYLAAKPIADTWEALKAQTKISRPPTFMEKIRDYLKGRH